MAAAEDLLAIDTVRRGQAVIVHVAGDIDVASAPWLENELRDRLAEQPALLVVDLTEVGFCGSIGLSVLGFAHARSGPTRLAVVAGVGVKRVLQLSGMAEALAVYDSTDEALADEPPAAGRPAQQ